MESEIFNSLYLILLEHKTIEVCVSQELEVWNDADKKVNDFFLEFIFGYGTFHELLEKSDAVGDRHILNLSLINGNILMKGVTCSESSLYYSDEEDEEDEEESTYEQKFRWLFDKQGNLLKCD